MEKICSDLKKISKLLMIIVVYQVVNLVMYFNTVSTLDASIVDMVDAAAQAMVPVVKALSAAPFILSILVYAFLCFKGHREADDPSPAKLHIILAFIWMLGDVLSIFSAVSMLVEGFSLMKIVDLVAAVASVILLFFYGKYAKEIRTVE